MNINQIKEPKIKETRELIRDKVEFAKWKLRWYDDVPRCRDFVCCHELMSCGIHALCGDCTIYETWKDKISKEYVCVTIDCMDCFQKNICEKVIYRDYPIICKIKFTEEDEKFIEKIKSGNVPDNIFDEFWDKHVELCNLFGFNKDYKESYKEVMESSKLSEKRCENCILFREERCSVIEFTFKNFKNVALFWIYAENSCSGFEKENQIEIISEE